MKQFYEVYHANSKLAPLERELLWTHNLLILSQSKGSEEREFYLKLAVNGRLSKRELERQLKNSAFERTMLSDLKLAPVVRVFAPECHGRVQRQFSGRFPGPARDPQ
jgi:hypothetical protein